MKFTRKQSGDEGELAVIELVQCPNCEKSLMQLPKHYPLFDIQCTGCLFQAQVKTNRTKPKSTILGAGWNIMESVLISGRLVPPLIVNFCWVERGVAKREIRFYPFLTVRNLEMYRLSPTHKQANYRMFRYVGLDSIPYLSLYSK